MNPVDKTTTALRILASLLVVSIKPGFLVLAILGLLILVLIATVALAAIYSCDWKRQENAQTVLKTLLGRK